MKDQEISSFVSANPATNQALPPHDLFNEIVAEPRLEITATPPRSDFRRRLLRIGAVIVAAFAIGAGVSWAATGEFPSALLFGHKLGDGLTTGEVDATSQGFSVLQPADENAISELPEDTLVGLQSLRLIPPSPSDVAAEDFKPGVFDLRPGTITAVGQAHTEPSGDVSIVAINGQICADWVEIHMSNCHPPAFIERHGMITSGHFGAGGELKALGLVDDRVTAIRIEGTDLPDVPVSDNVFEVTGLPEATKALVGIDSNGDEVTRRPVP
ncbi:MAG: hypothetical protein J0H66_06175 [Solirubrobacterales bacterium]|nr:hypothetical protein [Solirubrobacterales bacterium]OJU94975.1 MAG: hypothetical protein BGO23_07360 [Solirubrobacterales bacterium 67-14]